jgi:quinol monooxygenase YgiN
MIHDAVFHVATYIDVQPDATSRGIELIREYREASRKDAGNSGVDVVQETSRPNRFVIIERWKDESSFEAHTKTGPATPFRDRLKAIQNSPCDQRMHFGFAVGSVPAATGIDTVSVVTHVDVPPPRKDEAEILLKSLAEESRKDEGNLRYDIFQQKAPRTNHFTVFAEWKDAEAFASHEMRPHRRKFRETLWPMLGSPYDERLCKPLD